MKLALILFISIFTLGTLFPQEQTYELNDGTVLTGKLISETASELVIETSFGVMTILKSDILVKIYKVELNSGDSIIGEKIFEDVNLIRLKTGYGEIDLNKSDIKSIIEKGKEEQVQPLYYPQRPFGIAGLLFGGYKMDKNSEFSLGEEQLIDLFFDPTGYTLEQGTLYLSGLSFGFGLSDKLQISSKWIGFFYNDFNIRPKYQILEIGNWEKQQSLAVGTHFHTNWHANKYEWKSGPVEVGVTTKYWGEYYKIGEEPEYEYDLGDPSTDAPIIRRSDEYYNDESLGNMLELFGAYTYSTAREGLKGRVSHTVGGNIQFPADRDYFYRLYYGLDIDINRRLKMIGEIFYDQSYMGRNGSLFGDDNYEIELGDLSDALVPEPSDSKNIYFDFGFMYALNESFRFGIHFQPYIFAFYWKF